MRIIVGVTGASGVIMSYYLLKALKDAPGCEIHLVTSKAAQLTWQYETDRPFTALTSLADAVYEEDDLAAKIASGSFVTDGMIVLPCSMKTLAGIVSGYAENLLLRAADVTLKEGRRLVLVPRETPLNRVHLRNMLAVQEAGAVLVPPMLSFYIGADTVEAQVRHILGKALSFFGLKDETFPSWTGAAMI